MHIPAKQSGFTLFVSLVLLVMVSLFAVTAINMSSSNLRIAGNMQMRGEAAAAAQQAIEEVIESGTYFASTTSQTINLDINKDGTNDYGVVVAKPACLAQTQNKTTDPTVVLWDSIWDVGATATDKFNLGASVTINQGIRIVAGGACP